MRIRAWYAGVFAGLIAMLALGFVIIGPGRYDPSPPSLEDDPVAGIPGLVAYIDEDGCLVIAAASGATRRESACFANHPFGGTWIDGGTIAIAEPGSGRQGAQWTFVDAASGETTDGGETFMFPEVVRPPESPQGDTVDIDQDGDVYRINGGERVRIFEFDGPENRGGPQPVTWSPDGEWLLLQYYPRYADGSELWIVARDGSVAGTLATGIQGFGPLPPSWWIDGVGVSPEVRPLPDID